MGSGSFVLAHFSDSDKFLPGVEAVAQCSEVEQWNAVDGSVHLIMKLNSPAIPEQIARIDGVDILTEYAILANYRRNTALDRKLCQAYVFVETEAGKSESVMKALQEIDAVLFCSTLANGNRFILMLQATGFETIDGIIAGKIRVLDGVVRLKTNRVIELRGM